jgi:hypothetical protein
MKISYHPYKEVLLDQATEADEELLNIAGKRGDEIRRKKYSFVAMCYHPVRKRIIVGATNATGDILLTFNPKTRKFTSCGFNKTALNSRTTSKIHKGLSLDVEKDEVYFGIATLSPLPDIINSQGGLLLKYNFTKKKFSKLGTPTPSQFQQATLVDPKRKLMYFATNMGCFGVFDLKSKKRIVFEAMESTPHNLVMDNSGCVWGTHSAGSHKFFRYNPDRKRFEFPNKCCFPMAQRAANLMYPGAGPTDSIINGQDGFLYAASALGEFYRITPDTGMVKYLGKPFPGIRLPALAIGDDDWIYMAGARERASLLARYSRKEQRFELLGPIEHSDGTYLNYAHELCVVDGVCFIGETDNKQRSGFMWACEI